ncbi:hypothetical protein [Falsibacillus albus]|uniref:DUF1801 domain-containing protein n=1 Tax=Falsibacillus albus TaxID=2478915 RepID=A0A3L7JU91_9BACI|nr:hypothetical protein [Falsibacillus albus]RLQ93855.1 hypothetical protein D9X91_16440 [Falsibacillus albus]
MSKEEQFSEVFQALRGILEQYEEGMEVKADNDESYYLDTRYTYSANNKPIFFGAAKINKNYVSYHLMPVYVCPELLDSVSSELRKKMQGKSCFNFKKVEEGLFLELKELTVKGAEKFRQKQFIE